MTCLIVTTIIGLTCVSDAPPVGDCFYLPGQAICTVEAQRLPVRASWYNPALGGTNCVEPCDFTGNMTPVADCYNWCLGCPVDWYGDWLDFGDVGRWQCNDTGGAIMVGYGHVYTQHGWADKWFITLDFMTYSEPWFAYWLLNWRK